MVDEKSIYQVALNLEISHHTLARYVKLRLERQAIIELKTKFSNRQVFNKNEESEFAYYLKRFSAMFHSLSTTKKLDYELLLRNEKNMPTS